MIDATPLLRLYARARLSALARLDLVEAQRRQLLRLVRTARATRFGRDHDFAAIRSVEDFRRQVPLRRYEDFWKTYWQGDYPRLDDCTWPGVIPFFAVSSGITTGATKNIPCTRDYALVVSSCAGLWAYFLGDTVRLVALDPPRLVVTGRTAYGLSAFGEHLIGEQIEDAVATAASAIGCDVTDFTVGPLVPDGRRGRSGEGGAGGHLFIVEFAGSSPPADALGAFATALDARLSDLNEDYRVHRASDYGMAPPRIRALPSGDFAAWMKTRGRLGGQNKVPRVITDEALFRDLRSFVSRASGRSPDPRHRQP